MAFAIQTISSHPLLIREVEELLADLKQYQVQRSASDEAEAIRQNNIPRLFILDACSLPADLGRLAQRCRSSSPGSKFIALLEPTDNHYANEISLFYWGIDGFVQLSEAWKIELPQAIRSVLGGGYWVPPEVLTIFLKHIRTLEQTALLRRNSLTAREGQILRLLLRHLTNKEISRSLDISERTVKFHVSRILAKFGMEDRRGLLHKGYDNPEIISR